jgi:hypothetical protein
MVCEGSLGGPTCWASEPERWLSGPTDVWGLVTRTWKLQSCRPSKLTEKQVMNLHDFVQDENIRRYQRLLSTSKDDAERQTILKLLTEEIAKRNNQTGRKMPTAR